ncbi:Ig-like domain-containing protein [Halorubrum sp. Ea8]|uniref:Ig-like domain-containing protein n=1 Tax=Halorubrum sp. Ea8 TaxID=1383841 RepID=UPI000B995CDB|nr:Ig-like domain-containing protein [Halorubrum sp. Ea8]OYR44600.1 hypothetical protein DJ74_17555 [Halorubrum sp. Ea8]
MTLPDYVPSDAEDITDHGAVANPDDPDDRTPSANRSAIMDAIDAAGSEGAVYVPSGTYFFGQSDGNSWIQIGRNTNATGVSFYGDGPGESTLGVTRHTPETNIASAFLYISGQYGSTSHTVTFRGLELNGQSDKLGDMASNNVGQIGVEVQANNSGLNLNFEDVYLRNMYNSGIRMREGSLAVNHCTFERIGIDLNLDADGSRVDHCTVPSPEASNDDTVLLENSVFKLCSGNATDPGGDGHVTIRNCWAEGLGSALVKLNSNSLTIENTYARLYSEELENNVVTSVRRPFDGRNALYTHSADPGQVILNDVKFEDMTEQGMYAYTDRSWTIEGDNLVFDGVGTKRDLQGAALRESTGATFAWDMNRMSVHGVNSTFEVFDTGTGGGSIQDLRWGGADSLGSTGATTIDSAVEGGSVFEPNVPSQDEVGIRVSADGGGDDSVDDTDTSESDPVFDDWTPKRASSESDWDVAVSESSKLGDATLELSPESRGSHALSFDAAGEHADCDTVALCRIPSDNDALNSFARLYARGDEDVGQWGWTSIVTSGDEYAMRLRINDGSLTDLGEVSVKNTAASSVIDNWFYRRFEVTGNTWRVRMWDFGDDEPDGWDIEATTERVSDSGYVGVGGYSTDTQQFDYLSVGAGGESAELPGSDTPPSLSWKNPSEGETVSGTTTVQIASGGSEVVDSVEYRIDGGAWTAASYNADSGCYEDAWESTAVADGSHTLEASVSGYSDTFAVEVTVDNEADVTVATLGSQDVTDSTATLLGELTSLDGADEAGVGFESRESGQDTWNFVGGQTVDTVGEFSAELSGLQAETDYEFRAVVTTPGEVTGDILSLQTGSAVVENAAPTIDRFEVSDRSNPVWTRSDVDWTVSDANGNLDRVVTELRYEGVTVDAETTSVSGETDSYTHTMRVRGDIDEIRLSVNDIKNAVNTQSKSV